MEFTIDPRVAHDVRFLRQIELGQRLLNIGMLKNQLLDGGDLLGVVGSVYTISQPDVLGHCAVGEVDVRLV